MECSDAPQQFDLDRCVHCGLCLNACPTYRLLGVEMDSPRGRIYQMVQVSGGRSPITDAYVEHIDCCLACRGCETACPSGVQYGRLVEAARAQIQLARKPPLGARVLRNLVFDRLLPSRANIRRAARLLLFYQRSGLRTVARASGLLRLLRLADAEKLSPEVETPFFYENYGRVFRPDGAPRYRVALLGGCIANVFFARLNEATLRVLVRNGCEVTVPPHQACCGALHVHAGLRDGARALARRNIDALLVGGYDAIVTNAAGCGSALKEYGELFDGDAVYAARARQFSALVRDVTEFLAAIPLNPGIGPLPLTVTYQDSCHLAHGQKIKSAPRELLRAIPQLSLREMALADLCCGSAGIYNVVRPEMSRALLEDKMDSVNATPATVIATANPGCMLQLRAGVASRGRGQRVAHVVELLDEAYRAAESGRNLSSA
jgi:glycolate dehydrogenase iron-sulfur subunit